MSAVGWLTLASGIFIGLSLAAAGVLIVGSWRLRKGSDS